MSLYAVTFLGTTPIGSPLIGWIAEAFGVRAAFIVGGGAAVAAAGAALLSRARYKPVPLVRSGPAREETAA